MAIYRGTGSASSTSDQATIDEVTTQATNAANSATSAASSATSASSSASSASSSATSAATSATTATNKASEASASASAASDSASLASTSETNASDSETAASLSASQALASANNASAAQTAAETAETNAAASESTASTAATTATTKASEASTSATTASTAATTATNAATTAETARDQTLASFDSFDDRYLGSKTADPTLDNDGDALVGGALYFNSVDEVMKVYTGSQWVAAYADVSGALLAVNNLSDLNNATSARTNLGLGTAATTASTDYATAAQGTLADSATQPGDNISTLTNDSGYITDYTVTQGDVTTHQAALSITESQISDLQSYLTSIPDNYILNTGDAITGDLTFGDNDKAIFGAGSDLSIFHDSSNLIGVIENTTGDLYIRDNAGDIYIQARSGEESIIAEGNGAVSLYHNNAQKLATTSTGIDVTGTVTFDGGTTSADLNFGDNDKAVFGAGSDLQVYHDGSNSYIKDAGTGTLRLQGATSVAIQTTGGNNMAQFVNNGAVNLFHNGNQKIATDTSGVTVTGRATGTLTTDNDLSFDMNASNQFKCTPTGNGTLTFTNITAGQSGNIWLDNSGGHTISAAATTYISSADLTTISAAGVYFLSYYSDGTNVMVSATPAVTSAGA